MEVERSPQITAKRLWNIVRIAFCLIRKGISKTKLMLDLQMMLKRGKILGKAIENLLLQHHHHYAAFTCRPDDVHTSYISPRAYEFSCSNTPVVYPSFYTKRKHHHHRHRRSYRKEENVYVVEKVFSSLNIDHGGSVEASPLTTLPGFGGSPLMVRQLRVTDSPFSLKEMDQNNPQVDMDAEEFINKFYKELKKQKIIADAAFESPSPYHVWGR